MLQTLNTGDLGTNMHQVTTQNYHQLDLLNKESRIA